jgi:hypothetical protein
LRLRNQNRIGVTYRDATNLHYSWDWDGVHFVMLNVYSGAAAQGGIDPYGSYAFLEKDLAANVGGSGRPVFVMQHFPVPDDGWWPAADAAKLGALLKKYNCIGILHGHSHSKKMYKFQGMDVFDDGTVMSGDIFLFRITDGKFFAVNRIGNQWGNLVVQKNITMGSPTRAAGGSALPPDFTFSVAGLGQVQAANGQVQGIDIFNTAGRLVRSLAVSSRDIVWDRSDAAGRPVPPGVYLAGIRTRTSMLQAKFFLR